MLSKPARRMRTKNGVHCQTTRSTTVKSECCPRKSVGGTWSQEATRPLMPKEGCNRRVFHTMPTVASMTKNGAIKIVGAKIDPGEATIEQVPERDAQNGTAEDRKKVSAIVLNTIA